MNWSLVTLDNPEPLPSEYLAPVIREMRMIVSILTEMGLLEDEENPADTVARLVELEMYRSKMRHPANRRRKS